MSLGKKFDAELFWRVWNEVLDFVNSNKGVVIVEGKRDKKALSDLNVNKNVLTIQSIPNSEFEKIIATFTHFLILTDFDKEGDMIANKLGLELIKIGRKVNYSLREKVREAIKPFRHIEDLNHVINEVHEKMPFSQKLFHKT